jgi:hypothetical protein
MRRQPIFFNEKRLRETMERKKFDLVNCALSRALSMSASSSNNGGKLSYRLGRRKWREGICIE